MLISTDFLIFPPSFFSLPTSIHADYSDYHDTVMRHACVFILSAVRHVFPCGEVDMGYLVCVWLLMPAMRLCSFLEFEASKCCIIA